MSYNLPKATKTSKLNSLSGDLKSAAEELIAKKFGIKEVVESESSASFHYQHNAVWGEPMGGSVLGIDPAYGRDVSVSCYTTYGTDPTFVWQVGNSEVIERINPFSRQRTYSTTIHYPTTRSFRDAVHRLDFVNARRDRMEARLPIRFARELFSTEDFTVYADMDRSRRVGYGRSKGDYIGRLFGVDIFVIDGSYPEITATM